MKCIYTWLPKRTGTSSYYFPFSLYLFISKFERSLRFIAQKSNHQKLNNICGNNDKTKKKPFSRRCANRIAYLLRRRMGSGYA